MIGSFSSFPIFILKKSHFDIPTNLREVNASQIICGKRYGSYSLCFTSHRLPVLFSHCLLHTFWGILNRVLIRVLCFLHSLFA